MNATALWLMIAGMGLYQGLNPSMGWLFAVSRALEERSTTAALNGTTAVVAGHFAAMVAVLLPAALLLALAPADLMPVRPWLGAVFIVFGLFKLYRPAHPRFLARIRPDRPMRWSFAMAMTHCGSPLMMLGPLTGLLMLREAGGFGASAHSRLGSFVAAAVVVPAVMAGVLLLTATGMAVLIYRKDGLKALTRYWINLDLGWAVLFIAMGAMTLMM